MQLLLLNFQSTHLYSHFVINKYFVCDYFAQRICTLFAGIRLKKNMNNMNETRNTYTLILTTSSEEVFTTFLSIAKNYSETGKIELDK